MWKYAPDLEKTAKGVLTSITGGLIPTANGGWRGPYRFNSLWTNNTSGCNGYNGSFLALKTDGTARCFFGANDTTGRLYEVTKSGITSVRTDRSRAGNYTASAFFSFCQLGDVTIATNKSDALQSSTTGAFADVADSPPKAKFCVSDANQVVLLNYNDGTDTPDGWWCSDVGTSATWTVADGNEARNGRLRDTGGEITAACNAPFGGVLAFKRSSMYIGTYSGQPLVRQWRKVSDKIGCKWAEAAINVGEKVYFVGEDIYEFDGSRPVSITDGVIETIRVILTGSGTRLALQYDHKNDLLYLYYANSATDSFSASLVYNTRTKVWGNNNILQGPSGDAYYPVGVLNGTAAELGLVFSSTTAAAVFASNWVWGSATSSSITTEALGGYGVSSRLVAANASQDISWTVSYSGDFSRATTVQNVMPHIRALTGVGSDSPVTDPAAYTLAVTSRSYTPYGPTSGSASSAMNATGYRFNLLSSGHWHKATYTVDVSALTSNFEWFDHAVEYVQAGKA